mmetsp:Transcript_22823/g.19835  ORF Transcript_22823/g.19835 Transcript_22823/m.19835 type:complete len:89 (-) Transcript_22823:380-646(-)
MHPHLAEAYDNKGLALANLGRKEEAIEFFTRAIELDPNHIESFIWKGDMLFDLEKFEEALECYDRALEIDDTSVMAWIHKSFAHDRLN